MEVRTELPPRETTSAAAAGTLGLADAPPNALLGRWERAAHLRRIAEEGWTPALKDQVRAVADRNSQVSDAYYGNRYVPSVVDELLPE